MHIRADNFGSVTCPGVKMQTRRMYTRVGNENAIEVAELVGTGEREREMLVTRRPNISNTVVPSNIVIAVGARNSITWAGRVVGMCTRCGIIRERNLLYARRRFVDCYRVYRSHPSRFSKRANDELFHHRPYLFDPRPTLDTSCSCK